MSMIKVENLTFSYPSSYENIFEHVNFQIDTDWKLGFVGRNGRGKTTFLNLLQGKYEYSGKITSSVSFDYFPYHISDKSCLTEEILLEICPQAEEWELMRELSYLGVPPEALWRSFETLSNGEQTKTLLAALFLREGRFLLIDEPTNHLDAKARQILSSYLSKKKGFLLVSHDRYFLDECVDHILSLNRADIQVQAGNFSTWMKNFLRQQEFEMARNERLQKDISRLRQAAKRSAVWSAQVEASKIGAADKGFVGHKAAKMMKRSKSIEARQNQAVKEKSGLLKNVETAEHLKMFPLPYHTDTLVSFAETAVWYGKNMVCKPVSFTVRRGERIVLDGGNGSGKSSLMKILMGKEIRHTGTVTVGSGLVISYVPQDTSFLKGSLSDFAREQQIDETLFKTLLRKLDFGREQFEKDMAAFSEGQKKKTLLAQSLCQQAHLYVWDEPLNFVDVYSRIQIEELIKEYTPAMLLVEHDRAFREQVATRVVTIA
ncbi:ABC-F type ribosomal protection protein [Lachnospiraceae bacterium]|nr:ABC-F type ribosomal protection protein [Lachnospiraceae bacterium]